MGIANTFAAIALALLLAACDNPVAPNTSLGLRVWADIHPTVLRISDSTQSFTIRVNALNPSFLPASIVSGGPPYQMTSDPANSIGLSQSFRITSPSSARNGGPNTDWFGDSIYRFGPYQRSVAERSFTWADWRKGGWPIVAGEYRVRGYFNGQEGESAAFRIVP